MMNRPHNTILVVEDNPLIRVMLCESLTVANYNIVEAGSADEAMALFEAEGPFSLVVTDIEMPGTMNGIGLANAIHERWPEVALIVTSGRVTPAAGVLPACAKFVPKPSPAQHFVGLADGLLSVRQAPEWSSGAA